MIRVSNGAKAVEQPPRLQSFPTDDHHKFPLHNDILTLIILVISGVTIWSMGYQHAVNWSLPIGGDPITHRRLDDQPFLKGFNAPEPAATNEHTWWEIRSPGYPYRWTRSRATITVPGIGGGDWIVTLSATSGRPAGEATTSYWHFPDRQSFMVLLSATPRQYHLLARTTAMGDMVVHLHTTRYAAANDPRDLGFVLRHIRMSPLQSPLQPPALGQLGWLSLMVFLTYPLMRWLLWAPRQPTGQFWAAGVTVAVIGISGALLATHRTALTTFTPRMVLVTGVCWILAIPGSLFLRVGYRRVLRGMGTCSDHAGDRATRMVLLLTLTAFALRMGGMLHPNAVFSDHYLHANNVLEVGLGTILFTEGLPLRAGGGQVPYPPGIYLIAAPLLLIAPGDLESRVLIIQGIVAILDSLGVILVWALLMRAGVGRHAALLGATLMLAPVPILTSFSIGEYANIGGQALAWPVLALLTCSVQSLATSSMLALFVLWLCVGWLGHLGVAISLTFLLGSWGGMESIQTWFSSHSRRHQAIRAAYVRAMAGMILAATMVVLWYYSAPIFIEVVAARFRGTPGTDLGVTLVPPPPPSPFVRLITHLFSSGNRIGPVLVISGWFGALWLALRPSGTPRLARLVRVLLAWWIGVGCSLVMLLFTAQGVRWEHFLIPALCLGAGPLLAAWGRRGRSGSTVAWSCLLIVLSHGVGAWIAHIRSYLH